MADQRLDKSFIEDQKQRLLEIQAELERMRDGLDEDQRDRAEDEGDYTEHDSGDLGQSMFNREMDATIEGQVGRRLEDVERALEKIEEGSYGVCDDTGGRFRRGA